MAQDEGFFSHQAVRLHDLVEAVHPICHNKIAMAVCVAIIGKDVSRLTFLLFIPV